MRTCSELGDKVSIEIAPSEIELNKRRAVVGKSDGGDAAHVGEVVQIPAYFP
jgi:hypothetical protein